MTFRAVCLTENAQLKRMLRRSLQAAGGAVEFAASVELLEGALGITDADVIVLDPESRPRVDLSRLCGLSNAQVMVVGESIEQADVLELLRTTRLNHVIADVLRLEDDALIVTSGKMFQGDIFGVEKYLAWGALVHEREVGSYDEKRRALTEVARFAVDGGARRQVAARVEAVADELLMNALYDAPAVRHGVAQREAPLEEPALLRYACDGRTLGVSVRDRYGELRKDAILDHIQRARAMRGAPEFKPTGGAGLGLHMVVSSVTRFVANVDPGRMTEVIGLFDLDATGRELESCARSLHIFTSAR